MSEEKSAKKTNDKEFKKPETFLCSCGCYHVLPPFPFSSFVPSVNAQKLAVQKQRALKQIKKASWSGNGDGWIVGNDMFCNPFELLYKG